MAGFSLNNQAQDLSLALKLSERYRIQSTDQVSSDAILLQVCEH
jgi:hypothetical protein